MNYNQFLMKHDDTRVHDLMRTIFMAQFRKDAPDVVKEMAKGSPFTMMCIPAAAGTIPGGEEVQKQVLQNVYAKSSGVWSFYDEGKNLYICLVCPQAFVDKYAEDMIQRKSYLIYDMGSRPAVFKLRPVPQKQDKPAPAPVPTPMVLSVKPEPEEEPEDQMPLIQGLDDMDDMDMDDMDDVDMEDTFDIQDETPDDIAPVSPKPDGITRPRPDMQKRQMAEPPVKTKQEAQVKKPDHEPEDDDEYEEEGEGFFANKKLLIGLIVGAVALVALVGGLLVAKKILPFAITPQAQAQTVEQQTVVTDEQDASVQTLKEEAEQMAEDLLAEEQTETSVVEEPEATEPETAETVTDTADETEVSKDAEQATEETAEKTEEETAEEASEEETKADEDKADEEGATKAITMGDLEEEAAQQPADKEKPAKEAEAKHEEEKAEEPAKEEQAPVAQAFVKTSTLAVRNAPRLDSGTIGYLKYGSTLPVTDSTSYHDWIEVTYNDTTAYLNRYYVTIQAPAAE